MFGYLQGIRYLCTRLKTLEPFTTFFLEKPVMFGYLQGIRYLCTRLKTLERMKTDIQIARECQLAPIGEIASQLGIDPEKIEPYGRYMAKVPISLIDEKRVKQSRLILVTAISPTKAGIGKTTVSIGLTLGLNKLGKKAVVALREPSLGPCFGMKGGAAGGGYAQVLPMEKINLHFTGDFHAVTSAHNTISALACLM